MSTITEIEEAIGQLSQEEQKELLFRVARKHLEPAANAGVSTAGDKAFEEALESVFEDYGPLLEALSK